MSDFRRPIQARIMWDVVIFWSLVLAVTPPLTVYVIYRIWLAVWHAAQTQAHVRHLLGAFVRALWGF